MYPGWNQAFHVKKFNHREMESKHGPLQRTRRPWLDEYDPRANGYPWTSGTFNGEALIHLYHPAYIYHHLPEERECEMHYIDLFFQNRFFSSKSRPSDSRSPKPMLQAWINFVKEYVTNPLGYTKKIKTEREKFYANTSDGIAMDIHRLSISAGLNCTVPKMYKCLSCYSDSPRSEFVEVPNDPSTMIRLHQIHNKLINRLNFSMIKKSDDTKAEMARFERVAIKLQMENAELLTNTPQNDNELQTFRNWRSDHTKETITLQSQLRLRKSQTYHEIPKYHMTHL
ncbi:hypothetical protein FI667_g8953, partial [Globisporangium splendens]